MKKSAKVHKLLLFSATFILMVTMQLPVFGQTENGMELFNSMKFKNAEDAFRSALVDEPENIEAGYYLGMSLLMQGKYQEASGVFEKIKASGKDGIPDIGQLEIALTRIYLELKKYPEALKSLDAAKTAKADPADIHVYQGAYYLEKNDAAKAIEELEKAIAMDSKNAYAHYYAGHAYVRLGHPEKAVQMLKMFLELAPYAPEAEKAKVLVDALC
jgi:tetratricopeptide (TPR) repeat protein